MNSLLSFFLIFSLSAFAGLTHFDIRDISHRNSVVVISDALLERVVGMDPMIAGWIELNPENPSEGIKGELEVDLRALDTGIEIRNQVMREKFLETNKFPVATASFQKWTEPPTMRLSDKAVIGKVETVFKFRDKTLTQVIPLKLTYFKDSELTRQRLPGNLLKISGAAGLDLSHFSVSIPDSLKAIVSRLVEVSVDVVASDKLPLGTQGLPEGPKPKEQ